MATTKEMLDEAELAKSFIVNSDMEEDSKRTYIKLINITAEATNGISQEEKIQKMTEAVFLLAATQAKYMLSLDKKIDQAVAKANQSQCQQCKAMKHAVTVEEQEQHKQMMEQWKKQNGIHDNEDEPNIGSWQDIIKSILLKPYVYVVVALAFVSPYGVQIIEKLIQLYNK